MQRKKRVAGFPKSFSAARVLYKYLCQKYWKFIITSPISPPQVVHINLLAPEFYI